MPEAECAVCGPIEPGGQLLHRCRYCNRQHCSSHLLPENHGCPWVANDNIEAWISDREKFQSDDAGRETSNSPKSTSPKHTVGTKPDPDYPSSPPVTQTSNEEEENRIPIGTTVIAIAALQIIMAYGLFILAARYYKVPVAIGLILIASVAFGPVQMSDHITNPIVGDADEFLKDGGDAIGASFAGLVNTSNTTNESSEGKAVSESPTSTKSPSPSRAAAIEQAVHAEINDFRTENGLSTLSYDDRLADIARQHSQDMADNDFFSHTGSDGSSRSDRYSRAGYSCRVDAGGNMYYTGGENIYRMSYAGFSYSSTEIAEMTVDGWMTSPGHRQNILRPEWRNEGIGVYVTKDGRDTAVYVTQNFC